MMKKPVENAGAFILALLLAGCASDSTRPTQAPPPDVQDQRRQEEQRKQDFQQHEMELGELGEADGFVFRVELVSDPTYSPYS